MFAFILGCLYLISALIYLWLIKEKFNIFLLGSNTETSLNDLFACLVDVTGYRENPHYGAIRAGDIKNMVMTYSKANQSLNWTPGITLSEGIVKLAEEN